MEQTEREALHREVGCFDAHGDILYATVRERAAGRTNVIEEEFLPGMREGGIDARVAPIYLDAENARESALRRALGIADAFHKEVEETPALTAAETAGDLERDDGEVTLILGMEGAEPLKGSLALFDTFHRLGLRVLGLTHSRRNLAGDGAFFEPTRSGTPGGLSAFGVEVVERAGDLGTVVDVSHLNEPGFWDALDFAAGPVIASHSNCRALRDHPRNLTDEQIGALADAGGVVGINAIEAFLAAGDADLDDVVDHIEHVVDVAGIEHVGLGFDFYDYNLEYMSPVEREYMIDVSAASGIEGDREVANLAPALLDRGFGAGEVGRILKDNFVRVFKEALPTE